MDSKKSKSGWAASGTVRQGKSTELKRKSAEAIEHPEKNPQLGTPKPLKGFYPKKSK
jgi:hypothetical protein